MNFRANNLNVVGRATSKIGGRRPVRSPIISGSAIVAIHCKKVYYEPVCQVNETSHNALLFIEFKYFQFIELRIRDGAEVFKKDS